MPLLTRTMSRAALLPLLAAAALPGAARAQDWPDRPVSVLNGQVGIGGEARLTLGPEDLGYFDYTDYERSALRLIRLSLVTAWRPADRVSLVAELRAEGDSFDGHWSGTAYAAYVRLKPWPAGPLEVSAGRLPTAFGGFSRRVYGTDNLLIGYPLAYQYLTSLRPDAVPATADDLLAMRGRGWYATYPVGSPEGRPGVPLVNAFRYDTGVLVRTALPGARADVSVSITSGTLSNPRLGDDNGSPQVAARVTARPIVGLAAGVSAASGAFVADGVREALPSDARRQRYSQRALGADVEYSRDYWLIRSELVTSAWTLPALAAPRLDAPVRATSWLAEGRYTLLPGLYAAARYDRLFFSRIAGAHLTANWEADVWRLETGLGYSLRRGVTLKASYQYNRRDGGRVQRAHLGAGQVLLWF